MSDPFTTVSAELPRDRWGRPLIAPPEGGDPVAYMRVTTFVKCLDDTYHLERWKMRMVLAGAAARRDLVLATIALKDIESPQDKRTINALAEKAIEAAKGTAAATTGTALHSLTEKIDAGEDLGNNVPEEYLADLDAYRDAVRFMGRVVAMEGFCIVDDLRVGGSYDRIFEFTVESLDLFESESGHRLAYPDGTEVVPGDTIIGDLKTGKSIDFGIGAIAMQLATYANAVDYDHALGARRPHAVNNRKWAVVIHLPAGKGRAELVWVDIEAGWKTVVEVAPLVHAWRKKKDLSYSFLSRSSSTPPPVALPALIAEAPNGASLRALYAAHATSWTPGLTALSKARLVALGEV